MTEPQSNVASKPTKLLRRIAVCGVLVGIVALSITAYNHFRWKQFATVAEGAVYRSGQLRPEQLQSAIQSLKLKTVINLNPRTQQEESEICRRAGITCLNFDMPSDGIGKMDDYAVVLRTLRDPAQQPVLVHCQAGVARTGASIALYRMIEQGWEEEKALTELRSFERKGRRLDPPLRDHILSMKKAFESTTAMKK